jgi:predicted nuclease of predicted toxin-antitoxin system
MKILVDENIPLTTVRALRAQGHDVLDIRGTADEGIPDYALWEMAQREERLLITTDKGFVRHREQPHHGILIIRLRQPNRRKIHERVMQAIAQFKADEWLGLSIVMRDIAQSLWRASKRENKKEENSFEHKHP